MALRRPRSKRKAVAGCLTLAAVVAAVLLLGPIVRDIVDAPFNPWAHSWRGGPTLTGTWVGAVASPAGRNVGLYLDLRRAEKGGRSFGYSTCRTCPRIKGEARVCGGSGVAQAYEVWGSPDTWGGERFHLKLGHDGPEHNGPRLGHVTGEWRGDALNLATTLEHDGEGGAPGAGGQVRFEMRRGGEGDFSAACPKLSAD